MAEAKSFGIFNFEKDTPNISIEFDNSPIICYPTK